MIKKIIHTFFQTFGYDIHKYKKDDSERYFVSTDGRLRYYETPIAKYYLPDNAPQDVIFKFMREGEIFDFHIVDAAREFIKPGSIVLDIGANFGQMALLFSEIAGSEGEVYSFEAQNRVFNILTKNIEVNQAGNIKPFFNAVYKESNIEFHFPEPDLIRYKTYGDYNLPLDAVSGDRVMSLKIDDLKFDKPVSFMKTDIQGCDLFALQGAVDTIMKYRMPIIFEFEERFQDEYKTSINDYVKFVASIDYEFIQTFRKNNYLILPKEYNAHVSSIKVRVMP